MSIADQPVLAAEEAVGLADMVRAFVQAAQERAADGLTVREFGELTWALTRLAVKAADTAPVDGASRKAWVLHAVGILYDAVADKLVPSYVYPVWLMFRSGFRSLLIHLVSGSIEALLPYLRSA